LIVYFNRVAPGLCNVAYILVCQCTVVLRLCFLFSSSREMKRDAQSGQNLSLRLLESLGAD